MPHVVTQWESGQWTHEGSDARRVKSTSEYLRPIPVSPPANRNSGGLSPRPNMNLLGTPGSDLWDFGSIHHIKQGCTETGTPISAVESVFELPSNDIHESPNSSTHSSFIAELEDTSPIAVQSKRPAPPASPSVLPAFPAPPKGLHLRDRSMELKCNGNTVSLTTFSTLAERKLILRISLVPS